MSASLVGSEMCIRDRRYPSPPRSAWHPVFQRGEHFSQVWDVRWATPVSYTHLTLPTICSV
eukprot:10641598-Alexandrium_andersonii.AAC.1